MRLTSLCLEVWQRWNEDLLQEQRTAVHLDGAGQQTPEVVDVPDREGDGREGCSVTSYWFLFFIVNYLTSSLSVFGPLEKHCMNTITIVILHLSNEL